MEKVKDMEPIKLLEEAWKELQKWAASCRFDPMTEADIQCFLYHCLIERLKEAKDFHAEFPSHKERTHYDLVIDDKVFVEINYILRTERRTNKSWEARTKNAIEEIEKLKALKKERPIVAAVFAVFARSYSEEKDEPWYKRIREQCKKSKIEMLAAWKKKV
jgi:hypothetical protein